MKKVAVIQARMNSSRLPGKVAKMICNKTILQHIIDRLKQSKYIDDIVVATSTNNIDKKIEEIAIDNGVKIFRGNETNVLERFYFASKNNNANVIIRLTADNPLIDVKIIDNGIELFIKSLNTDGIDYLRVSKGYPLGMGMEIFTFHALEEAYINAKEPYELEHVTPYLYDLKNNFKIKECFGTVKDQELRLTVDTKEDFKLVEEIYKELYYKNKFFGLQEILELLNKRPQLLDINKEIKQKKDNRIYK